MPRVHLRKWQKAALNAALVSGDANCLLLIGPSGCGKSVLAQQVLAARPNMRCFVQARGTVPSWRLLDAAQAEEVIRSECDWYEELLDADPVACRCLGNDQHKRKRYSSDECVCGGKWPHDSRHERRLYTNSCFCGQPWPCGANS